MDCGALIRSFRRNCKIRTRPPGIDRGRRERETSLESKQLERSQHAGRRGGTVRTRATKL